MLCFTVPPAPVLSETPTVTATTITITGTVPSGSVVTGFMVEWQRDTSVGCSDGDEDRVSMNGAFTSYTITGLEPGNRYTITVTVNSSLSLLKSIVLSVVLTLFAASDVYQAESVASSCECDNTAAIIGGVVAVVFIVTAAVTTVVILRSCRGHYSTPKTRTRYI